MANYCVAKNETTDRVHYNSSNGQIILLPRYDLLRNLISIWELNEASGDAIDAYASNDGTVNGATRQQTTVTNLGYSYSFDGNDNVLVPYVSAFDTGSELSAFCWVKTTSSGSVLAMLGCYETTGNKRRWYIGMETTGKMRVIISKDGTYSVSTAKFYITTSATINDGSWHHIGFTFNSGTLKLYIDGTEITSITKTADASFTTIYSTDSDLTIGSILTSGAGVYYYTGYIDQPVIWDGVLNQDQITALYNSGAGLAYSIWN